MTMRPLARLLSTCAFIGALTCICVDASAGETQGKQAVHRLVAKKDELPAFFDCLRETEAVIVSAHRGGPSAGYPKTQSRLSTIRCRAFRRSSKSMFKRARTAFSC